MTPTAREHVNVQLLLAEMLERVPLPELIEAIRGVAELDDARAMARLQRAPYATGFLFQLANVLLCCEDAG